MNQDNVENQMPMTSRQSAGSVAIPEADAVIDLSESESGAAASFAAFYEHERSAMVRALSLALHDSDFGADAADEAFVRACQQWSTVNTLDNPAGWVYRVGLNWANSALRRRRRHRAKLALLAGPHASSDVRSDIDLQRALAELSDDHRAVVVCRYYLDWTVGDTADALAIPTGTVKSRLARALEQLESILRPTPREIGSPK